MGSAGWGALARIFSFGRKRGFMKEFLGDLLSDAEFRRLSSKLNVLEQLFMGTPYSYICKTEGLSPNAISDISKKTADKKGGYYRVMRSRYPKGFRYFE